MKRGIDSETDWREPIKYFKMMAMTTAKPTKRAHTYDNTKMQIQFSNLNGHQMYRFGINRNQSVRFVINFRVVSHNFDRIEENWKRCIHVRS